MFILEYVYLAVFKPGTRSPRPFVAYSRIRKAYFIVLVILLSGEVRAQQVQGWQLAAWPVKLETEFALSALPAHMQEKASVYLLDPGKGYYLARQGTNGFVCFVARTEWEWAHYDQDVAIPMSFDAAGTKSIFPVYQDVAAMRSTGKFSAVQIRDSVINRIRNKRYQAPAAGISYMLAPLMRSYSGDPGDNTIQTISAPHYMYYAPYLTDADIGGQMPGPFIGNPGETLLGKKHSPFGYIIIMASQTSSAAIWKTHETLIAALAAYQHYLAPEGMGPHHHEGNRRDR